MLRYNGRIIESAGLFGQYSHVIREIKLQGRNTNLTSLTDLWIPGAAVNGVHTLITSAITLAVSSGSANDVVGGSGAAAVFGTMVDGNGVEWPFFLPLNGQSKVVDGSGITITGVNDLSQGPVCVQCTLNGTTSIKVPWWVGANMVASVKVSGQGIPAATTVSSVVKSGNKVEPATLVLNNAATLGSSTVPVNVYLFIGGGQGASAGKIYAYDSTDTITTGENNTIAKRLSILDIGEVDSRTGWYTVPKVGAIAAELLVLSAKTNVVDNTTTIKYMYSQILANFLKRGEQILGQPGFSVFTPIDVEMDANSGGAADFPPANIFEPLMIVGNGGVLNIKGSASAAPAPAAEATVWGLLMAPNTL